MLRILCLAFVLIIHLVAGQHFNPSILQDSRDLPKTDGTFGFLYRTEDGIAHAAQGDSNGVIHGRFSYTDPTGLKVNYNYNAGSRFTPGYNYDDSPAPKQYNAPPPPPPPQPQPQPEQDYAPQPQYNQRRPSAQQSPRYTDDVHEVYQQRRARPRPVEPRRNEIYDDYYN